MGGHGGLNILPQKRWNVYNYENRERVRRDEEAAAREEYIKQQEALKKEAEVRLQKLREKKRSQESAFTSESQSKHVFEEEKSSSRVPEITEINERDSKHINLFNGWDEFESKGPDRKISGIEWKVDKEIRREAARTEKRKRKDEETRASNPDDEKCRLGYGIIGKDVKKPWYLSKSSFAAEDEELDRGKEKRSGETSQKKKSLQELREERLKREREERERAAKLLSSVNNSSNKTSRDNFDAAGRTYRPYYNSGYGNAR